MEICRKIFHPSEERQLMKWVGIFQVGIFWMGIFRGEVWWVGIFPGEIFLEPFSRHRSWRLLVQSQQWKQQYIVLNLHWRSWRRLGYF